MGLFSSIVVNHLLHLLSLKLGLFSYVRDFFLINVLNLCTPRSTEVRCLLSHSKRSILSLSLYQAQQKWKIGEILWVEVCPDGWIWLEKYQEIQSWFLAVKKSWSFGISKLDAIWNIRTFLLTQFYGTAWRNMFFCNWLLYRSGKLLTPSFNTWHQENRWPQFKLFSCDCICSLKTKPGVCFQRV